jgi:hypothetical protein
LKYFSSFLSKNAAVGFLATNFDKIAILSCFQRCWYLRQFSRCLHSIQNHHPLVVPKLKFLWFSFHNNHASWHDKLRSTHVITISAGENYFRGTRMYLWIPWIAFWRMLLRVSIDLIICQTHYRQKG